MAHAQPRRFSSAFTMIEIMIVLALIATLAMLFYFAMVKYFLMSRDSVRKTHLEKYRVALEEYFTDNGKYPPASMLSNCGSGDFQPYLPNVYCDPLTNEPYKYVVNLQRTQYNMYVQLDNPEDEIISQRGCENGCGPDENNDGKGDYNYGVSNNQAVTGGNKSHIVSPNCFTAGRAYCPANQCGNCCPGSQYRCNAAGNGCYEDSRCLDQ